MFLFNFLIEIFFYFLVIISFFFRIFITRVKWNLILKSAFSILKTILALFFILCVNAINSIMVLHFLCYVVFTTFLRFCIRTFFYLMLFILRYVIYLSPPCYVVCAFHIYNAYLYKKNYNLYLKISFAFVLFFIFNKQILFTKKTDTKLTQKTLKTKFCA